MVSLDAIAGATTTSGLFKSKPKLHLTLDKYASYARHLHHREPASQPTLLRSKVGRILQWNGFTTTHLDPCQWYNLFGPEWREGSGKAKVSPGPTTPPPTATKVTIATVRSGSNSTKDHSEHLKIFFSTPRVLHPGHLFALSIPENIPAATDLASWVEFAASRSLSLPSYTVHFKVVSVEVEGGRQWTDFFTISSEATTLFEGSALAERLLVSVPHQTVDIFYKDQMGELLEIATAQQPLMISSEKGGCVEELVANLAGHLGLPLHPLSGLDLCGEAAGSLETKLERVEVTGPALVHLSHTELLGRTRDGSSPDARVIAALRALVERLTRAAGVWVVGSCTDQEGVLMPVKHLFDLFYFLPLPSSDTLTQFLGRFVNFEECVEMVKARMRQQSLRTAMYVLAKARRHLGVGLNANERVGRELLERILPALPSTSVRETRWEDIGGVDHVRREVEETVELPLRCPELSALRRSGLLLYGAPGCGKTMVARAVATQCSLTFHSVQGPELLNSFVGQSEANVRAVFEAARRTAPSVVFFDEIDAIAPRRSGGVIDRVLAQLLSELDGEGPGSGGGEVFVIAATNRPELLDPAIMRPGRLDKHIHVSVGKDVTSRVQVFTALSRQLALDEGVCFRTVAEMAGPLSGAECYGVLLGAAYRAIERCVESGEKKVMVKQNDIISVLTDKFN